MTIESDSEVKSLQFLPCQLGDKVYVYNKQSNSIIDCEVREINFIKGYDDSNLVYIRAREINSVDPMYFSLKVDITAEKLSHEQSTTSVVSHEVITEYEKKWSFDRKELEERFSV